MKDENRRRELYQLQRENERLNEELSLSLRALAKLSLFVSRTNPSLDRSMQEIRNRIKSGTEQRGLLAIIENLGSFPESADSESFDKGAQINGSLEQEANSPENLARSLLQKLPLSKDEKLEIISTIIQRDYHNTEELLTGLGALLADRFEDKGESLQASEKQNSLVTILLNLTEHFSLHAPLQERLLTLKKDLQNTLLNRQTTEEKETKEDAKERKFADQLFLIILDYINSLLSEKNDLRIFLSEILKKLEQVNGNVQNSVDSLIRIEQDSRVFENNFQEQVNSMKNEVASSNDVEIMKRKVDYHLQKLEETFQNFNGNGQELISTSKTSLQELQQRMLEMQTEMEKWKIRYQEQLQLLMRDSLTKAFSRYAFDQQIQKVSNFWKQGDVVSFALLDIDFFKKINDGYGHKAGDQVLQWIAKTISDKIKDEHFFARIGGEEFALLMEKKNKDQALKICETLREAVASQAIKLGGKKIRVSLSIGISEAKKSDSIGSLYTRADQALYQSKNAGRNRSTVLMSEQK